LSDVKSADVRIERLREEDLGDADRIFRLAFGTFMGVADPSRTFGDREMIANRWRYDPSGILGAYLGGELVGSNSVTKWGTFGWFGPLSVRPDLWDKGVAKQLLTATMELFSRWHTTQEGLFTFAQSPKHVSLYQKFGFHAQYLTPIMEKKVQASVRERGGEGHLTLDTFSDLASDGERERTLEECRQLTGSIHAGLDVSDEIDAAHALNLGDTILVKEGLRITGLAVCHIGPGTEAGSDRLFIKFGMVASGSGAEARFRYLLGACEAFASRKGVGMVEAGVNIGRSGAYREMLALGFRTQFQGVAMQRPNLPGYNRPDVFAIDDWR
jgi:GNAT superfamily N-acetyltransferase